jgi:voltage-gated potassium channel
MQIKDRLTLYLEDIETPIGKIVNMTIALLVMASTAIFAIQTYPLSPELHQTIETIDRCILFIFAIEYLLRLAIAKNKLEYLISFYSIVDLIAIVPFITGAADISFLRIVRWFRILRLLRFIEGKALFGNLDPDESIIVTRVSFTIFAIIFIYSGLIYQVEHPVNPAHFRTFLDAVYFAVATMTTVGFGDVVPTSDAGKFLTILMILTGIALIPRQLAELIQQFVKSNNPERKTRQTICANCQLSTHDRDAIYCKNCGSKIVEK